MTLQLDIEAEVIYWRGPSPFYFLKLPIEAANSIKLISKEVTYGWGVIPADVKIKSLDFYTALIPKDETYLLPLKKAVREKAEIELADIVKASIQVVSRK